MCGIAGTFGQFAPPIVDDLLDALAHRGPTERRPLVKRDNFTCGVCRLSITNRSSGVQPHVSRTGITLVSLNGQIYNYRELAMRLCPAIEELEGISECQVIAAGYELHGPSFFAELRGMFAIALYDVRVRSLYLLRDHFGIKPLYFSDSERFIAYSSEIKAFFRAGICSDAIDPLYSSHQYVFDFGLYGRTLFSDVQSVVPGTYIQWSESAKGHEIFEMPHLMGSRSFPRDDASLIQPLLRESIKRHIPNEVPWSLCVSGGIDSSILAWCASQETRRTNLFTLRDDLETADLFGARATAKHLGLALVEYHPHCSPEEVLLDYLRAREESEIASLFWFVMAHGLAEVGPVAICGQGADELFCGYGFHHDAPAMMRYYAGRLAAIHGKIESSVYDQLEEELAALTNGDETVALYKLFLREQLTLFQLEAVDKCCMASGVEMRIPYLDENLVSLVAAIPLDELMRGEKDFLRSAFRKTGLPSLRRQKQFSGMHTIPTLHNQIETLCAQIVPDSSQYRSEAWIADTPVAAVCREALLLLMVDWRGRNVEHRDTEEFYERLKARLRRPRV